MSKKMTGKEIRYWMPSGPRTDEDFMAGDDAKIFVIGCEILAHLALTFDWVQVIDLDTIGIDNSNHLKTSFGRTIFWKISGRE
ncbi:nedd8 activating enzyme [Lentinula edodes]|uniref:Nedd8 activating enzyme n=1 Tax=Lentinula edodes TaxID=5353 RepID=A0A1Q3E1S7_LENED|nr:nedd8 activating enzyme [Lentinula edodes]